MSMKTIRKVTVCAAVALASIGALNSSSAGSGQAVITGGHPGTVADGVTELALLSSCKGLATIPASTQGVDGWVIDVSGNDRFYVTGSALTAGPFNLNVRFYSGPKCDFMSVPSRTLVGTSYGVPNAIDITNARFAVVTLAYGANVQINWNAYLSTG